MHNTGTPFGPTSAFNNGFVPGAPTVTNANTAVPFGQTGALACGNMMGTPTDTTCGNFPAAPVNVTGGTCIQCDVFDMCTC